MDHLFLTLQLKYYFILLFIVIFTCVPVKGNLWGCNNPDCTECTNIFVDGSCYQSISFINSLDTNNVYHFNNLRWSNTAAGFNVLSSACGTTPNTIGTISFPVGDCVPIQMTYGFAYWINKGD